MPRARPGVGPGTRRSMTRRVSGRGLGLDFSGGPPGDSGESARPRRRTAVAATAIMMSDPVSRYRQQSQWALGRTQNSRSRVGTRPGQARARALRLRLHCSALAAGPSDEVQLVTRSRPGP